MKHMQIHNSSDIIADIKQIVVNSISISRI